MKIEELKLKLEKIENERLIIQKSYDEKAKLLEGFEKMKADHERDKEEFAAINESKIDKKDFYA